MKHFYSAASFFNFIILFYELYQFVYGEQGCPPEEDIIPCKCYHSPLTNLECSNLYDNEKLIKVFTNSNGYNYNQV